MTENSSVPGPRRDLAMHNDWFVSGWVQGTGTYPYPSGGWFQSPPY
jgi:hypothetical protein